MLAAGDKEIGLMSSAVNWARKELERDVANPWQSRRQREPNGRKRWLTHGEAEKLLNAAATRERLLRWPWLRDFIRLGLYTGMRPGEMLWLDWQGVDLKGAAISFEAETGAGQKKGRKNGKAGRVPMNQEDRATTLARARGSERNTAQIHRGCSAGEMEPGSRASSMASPLARGMPD